MEECVANVVCGMRFFRVALGRLDARARDESCRSRGFACARKWFALCANVPHLKIEIWAPAPTILD